MVQFLLILLLKQKIITV